MVLCHKTCRPSQLHTSSKLSLCSLSSGCPKTHLQRPSLAEGGHGVAFISLADLVSDISCLAPRWNEPLSFLNTRTCGNEIQGIVNSEGKGGFHAFSGRGWQSTLDGRTQPQMQGMVCPTVAASPSFPEVEMFQMLRWPWCGLEILGVRVSGPLPGRHWLRDFQVPRVSSRKLQEDRCAPSLPGFGHWWTGKSSSLPSS